MRIVVSLFMGIPLNPPTTALLTTSPICDSAPVAGGELCSGSFYYMLECLLQKFCMRFIVAIVFGTLFLTIFGHEEVVNFPKVCFVRV